MVVFYCRLRYPLIDYYRGGLLPYVDARSRISPFSTEGISSRDAASAASVADKEMKPSPVVPLKNYGEVPDRDFGRKLQARGADDVNAIVDMLRKLGPGDSRKEPRSNSTKAALRELGSGYNHDSDDDRDETPRIRRRSRLRKLGEMRRLKRDSNANRDIDEEEEVSD